MTGVVPEVNTRSARHDSVDSSPESRRYKKPKMDSKEAAVKVGRKRETEQSSACVHTTTAYTLSAKDDLNLRIVTKDPSSTQTKVAINAKSEVYSHKRTTKLQGPPCVPTQ
jgi:hypothetical protein